MEEYKKSWENGRRIFEGLYLETDDKIKRFKTVSTVFKERTIDRTRKLFGNRRIELDQYIETLDGYSHTLFAIH